MNYIITIPHWTPTSVNQQAKGHWSQFYKKKTADKQLMAYYCREQRIPGARGKRMVHTYMILEPKPGRKVDPDNVMKVLLDSLKHARMIIDDSDKWCDWTKPTVEKGTKAIWGTRIIIEDL
jgi:Holliday junction resolvase RusA-like endonuclease